MLKNAIELVVSLIPWVLSPFNHLGRSHWGFVKCKKLQVFCVIDMQTYTWELMLCSVTRAGMCRNTSTAGTAETGRTRERNREGTETQVATWTGITQVSLVTFCLMWQLLLNNTVIVSLGLALQKNATRKHCTFITTLHLMCFILHWVYAVRSILGRLVLMIQW